MGKPVDYVEGARRDFDDAFNWYAQRSVGAAIGFVAAVDDAIDKISEDPERFPFTFAECRSCSLAKYPFRVVFHVEVDRVVIIAIAHAKRRPDFWHDRL